MANTTCLWCHSALKPSALVCPECGLERPDGNYKETKVATTTREPRRRWRFALAFVVAPLMLSAAYAARVVNIPLVTMANTGALPVAPVASALPPPGAYSDPIQRSVWIDGVKAVRLALAEPSYANFSGSYVSVAAGHVVTFCGEVAGTSGYDSETGSQRYISVFGQRQATMLEGSDASFGVLWTRVCSQDESPA